MTWIRLSLPTVWPAVSLIPVVCSCVLFCLLPDRLWISSSSLLCFTPLHLSIPRSDSPSLVKPTPMSHAEVDDLASPSSLTQLFLFFCFRTYYISPLSVCLFYLCDIYLHSSSSSSPSSLYYWNMSSSKARIIFDLSSYHIVLCTY